MNATYDWAKQKPKPQAVPDGYTAALCGKCGGNGKYVMAVVNGAPWSATGTTCFACDGKGWIIRRKPTKKTTCPVCGIRQPVGENGQPVEHSYIRQVGDDFIPVVCGTTAQ
jgi:hypothetical protein